MSGYEPLNPTDDPRVPRSMSARVTQPGPTEEMGRQAAADGRMKMVLTRTNRCGLTRSPLALCDGDEVGFGFEPGVFIGNCA
jgi:hypothetical protein